MNTQDTEEFLRRVGEWNATTHSAIDHMSNDAVREAFVAGVARQKVEEIVRETGLMMRTRDGWSAERLIETALRLCEDYTPGRAPTTMREALRESGIGGHEPAPQIDPAIQRQLAERFDSMTAKLNEAEKQGADRDQVAEARRMLEAQRQQVGADQPDVRQMLADAGVAMTGDAPPKASTAEMSARSALAELDVPIAKRPVSVQHGGLSEAGKLLNALAEGEADGGDSASPDLDRDPCSECDGDGTVDGDVCDRCGGSGYEPATGQETPSSVSGQRRSKQERQRISDDEVVGGQTAEAARSALSECGVPGRR